MRGHFTLKHQIPALAPPMRVGLDSMSKAHHAHGRTANLPV